MSKAWFIPLVCFSVGCQDVAYRCALLQSDLMARRVAAANLQLWETRARLGQPSPDSLAVAQAAYDSIPDLRPSDSLWLREHCWQGRPRDP